MPAQKPTSTKKRQPAKTTTPKRTAKQTTPTAPAGYALVPMSKVQGLGLALDKKGIVQGLRAGMRLVDDNEPDNAVAPAPGSALGRFQVQVQALNEALEQARGGPNARKLFTGLIAPEVQRPSWVLPWLEALALTGTHTAACRAAGIDRATPYRYLERNPDFKVEWDNAKAIADDGLLEAARRRAVDGTLRPVFQKQEFVGYEYTYSDNLLLALLKSRFPEFADRYVVHIEQSRLFVLTQNGYTVDQALLLLIEELERSAPAPALGTAPVLALGAGQGSADNNESESDN